MVSDIEIMNRGIHCLLEKLGVVETERFIAVINREKFDYTKWQREHFDEMSSDEFNSAAVAYSEKNHFVKRDKPKVGSKRAVLGGVFCGNNKHYKEFCYIRSEAGGNVCRCD